MTEFSAILSHRFGKRQIGLFCGGDVTGASRRFGDPSLRKLPRNAVRWANGSPLPLEADAPLAVEVRLYQQLKRYIVPLMNYTTSQLWVWEGVGARLLGMSCSCETFLYGLHCLAAFKSLHSLRQTGIAFPSAERKYFLAGTEARCFERVVVE